MQRAAALRANRTTHWAAAAWKPEGPAGFDPISARPVLSVAPLRTATVRLILGQIPLGRMVPLSLTRSSTADVVSFPPVSLPSAS